MEKTSHLKPVLLLVVISYFLLMFGNGIVSLTHPDEVFYTQTAKEMLERNEWLTPYIFDQPQFEKPVFTYWLLMIAIKIFGLTPFAARFWPAIFGMAGVLATYGLAYLLFKSKRLAFLSGVVLSSSLIYVTLSRAVLTDMIFSIFVVLSLVVFYFGYFHRKFKDLSLVLVCVISATAVLTKGILGLIFPAVVILAFLSYKRELGYLKSKAVVGGIVLFALIAVPWHIAMYQKYGDGFIQEYFQNVHVRRIFDAEHQKSNTWHFYPMTMAVGVFPWSFFLIPAGILVFQRIRKWHRDKDQMIFLLFWIFLIAGGMQIAHSKLASYIFPVFPAMAVIIAYGIEIILRNEDETAKKIFRALGFGLAGLFLVFSIGSVVYAKMNVQLVTDMRPIFFVSILLAVCGICLGRFVQRKLWNRAIGTTACFTAALLAFLLLGRPYAEPWVSCEQIAEELKKIDQSDTTVLTSKFFVRGIRYYTDRTMAVIDINGEGFFSPHPIPFLNTDHAVWQFLKTQSVTYCVLKHSNVEDLKRIVGQDFKIEEITENGGKFLLKVTRI